MAAEQCPHPGNLNIMSYCDASWNVDSVPGAVLLCRGCGAKFSAAGNRKYQPCPQLKLKSVLLNSKRDGFCKNVASGRR